MIKLNQTTGKNVNEKTNLNEMQMFKLLERENGRLPGAPLSFMEELLTSFWRIVMLLTVQNLWIQNLHVQYWSDFGY